MDFPPVSTTVAPSAPVAREGNVLKAGTNIGRFVVLGLLGKGGMGEVYAAHDPELNRNVAIKLLGGGADSASPEARGRFMREARAIARVSHPNVIVVYDVGTVGDRVFIAMEMIDGHTLRYWTHARSRTWPEVLEVFLAAGRGLAAAHERELVHRDYKPDNVMIAADGQERVMDFGLVQLRGERPGDGELEPGPASAPSPAPSPSPSPSPSRSPSPASSTGVSLGTPAYMSPEQFGNQPTDARTDQFSFCVALYQALYATLPFAGAGLGQLMAAVTEGRVQPPPAKSAVPPWLRRDRR